jgi:hypothetical protein
LKTIFYVLNQNDRRRNPAKAGSKPHFTKIWAYLFFYIAHFFSEIVLVMLFLKKIAGKPHSIMVKTIGKVVKPPLSS